MGTSSFIAGAQHELNCECMSWRALGTPVLHHTVNARFFVNLYVVPASHFAIFPRALELQKIEEFSLVGHLVRV